MMEYTVSRPTLLRPALTWLGCAALTTFCAAAQAVEPPACKTVRFGLMSWTDLIAVTTTASLILDGLGYSTEQTTASQQIVLAGMRDDHLDAFLGYWKPSSDALIAPFADKGEVKIAAEPNLADAQMTLAVPTYEADQGLKTFADIARFKDKLQGRIYGIDPGTNIDNKIKKLIDDDRFGLKGFKLMESSEAGMLTSAKRAVDRKEWVVFIAWKPHPMNVQMNLTYLTGSQDVLGADEGAATVWSVTRKDYAQQCPNANRLLTNLRFSAAQESEMMGRILNHEDPQVVAKDFIAKHPDVVKNWLDGVKAYDGGEARIAALNQP